MSSRQDIKHPASAVDPSSRWRFNNSGQLSEQEGGWDLSDELVRLKLNDGKEDGAMRTPPQSRLSGAVIASPLDTASSASSSPNPSDRHSHSRGPSVDNSSPGGNKLGVAQPSLKIVTSNEPKERPRSFSGTLSTSDLRRLQTAGSSPVVETAESPSQWTPTQFRGESEQLPYPSLANNMPGMPRQGLQGSPYEIRSGGGPRSAIEQDVGFGGSQYVPGRPNMTYRTVPRGGYPQQGMIGSPTSLGFSGNPALSTNQQLYEMMLAENGPQAGNRQQIPTFRNAHQQNTSDPAREAAAGLALLNGTMPPFTGAPGMFPPANLPGMAMYGNQFYPQDGFARGDPSQILAARLQAQYTGTQTQYGMMTPPIDSGPPSSNGSSQNGPSANNRKLGLYKTELCRSWEEKGTCRYGNKCQFAHGEDELHNVSRHPKYKTEICRTFWVSGSCPYGKRCCFIHTELPNSGQQAPGGPPLAENSPQATPQHVRNRSSSTASDPNEAGGVSLLARISAKRTQDSSTPVDNSSGYQLSRPPTGSLRVDTSSLDAAAKKPQNKSAYPTFASNGVLIPANDSAPLRSPAPVTAGPDFGRQSSDRLEIVGYNRGGKGGTPPTHNPRHSFNGTEDVNFSPSPPAPSHSYKLSSGDSNGVVNAPRVNGHVRSGSAGNWGSFTSRNSHLSNTYNNVTSPADNITSPWTATEMTAVGSRLNDKTWG